MRTGRKRREGAENLAGRAILRLLESGDGAGLPPAVERWRKLLKEKNPVVRLAAEKFLFEALHGKAKPWEEPPTGPITITVDVSKEPSDPAACTVEMEDAVSESTEIQ